MALLTQKAILSAFSQMLEEMPFDKITGRRLRRRPGRRIKLQKRPDFFRNQAAYFCICRYRNSERLAFTTRLTKRIISSLAYLS